MTTPQVPAPAVMVVGSTMMDMITYVDRIPTAGETVHGNTFSLGFGGKGANQAVMARRLGASVVMVTCVGDDVFAEMTLENLAGEGVDTTYVRNVSGVGSGVAPIWVEPDGTNRIIVVAGANARLSDDLAREAVQGTAQVDVVLGQFEVPQPATAAAFRAARERGATTLLNPAPAARVDEDLVSVTDWLIPNEVEFAYLAELADIPLPDGFSEAVVAAVAAELGVRLLVTLGGEGAALVSGSDVVRIAAPQADVVDTTGAGDAFVGAFAFGLAAGLPAADAVRLGCACASASVTQPGTQVAFLSAADAAAVARSYLA